MSIGSELLSILINLVIILVAGGLFYEFANWSIRNIILPVIDLNKELNNIPTLLTKYAKAFSDSSGTSRENLSKISNEIKILANKIIGDRETIPLYGFLAKIGAVNSHKVTDEIIRSLNFLAAALFEQDQSSSTISMVQQKIISLEDCLGVEKHSSRRIKIDKKPKVEEVEQENAMES